MLFPLILSFVAYTMGATVRGRVALVTCAGGEVGQEIEGVCLGVEAQCIP